MITEQAKIMIS